MCGAVVTTRKMAEYSFECLSHLMLPLDITQ